MPLIAIVQVVPILVHLRHRLGLQIHQQNTVFLVNRTGVIFDVAKIHVLPLSARDSFTRTPGLLTGSVTWNARFCIPSRLLRLSKHDLPALSPVAQNSWRQLSRIARTRLVTRSPLLIGTFQRVWLQILPVRSAPVALSSPSAVHSQLASVREYNDQSGVIQFIASFSTKVLLFCTLLDRCSSQKKWTHLPCLFAPPHDKFSIAEFLCNRLKRDCKEIRR